MQRRWNRRPRCANHPWHVQWMPPQVQVSKLNDWPSSHFNSPTWSVAFVHLVVVVEANFWDGRFALKENGNGVRLRPIWLPEGLQGVIQEFADSMIVFAWREAPYGLIADIDDLKWRQAVKGLTDKQIIRASNLCTMSRFDVWCVRQLNYTKKDAT